MPAVHTTNYHVISSEENQTKARNKNVEQFYEIVNFALINGTVL